MYTIYQSMIQQISFFMNEMLKMEGKSQILPMINTCIEKKFLLKHILIVDA